MTSEDSLDIQGLLKLMNVRVNTMPESLLERLIEYIRVMSEVCGYDIFVFVNINSFLTTEDMRLLTEFIILNKLHFVNVSGSDYETELQDNKVIVDADKCVIAI